MSGGLSREEKAKGPLGSLIAVASRAAQRLGFRLAFLSFPLALLWRALFAGEAFFWGTPLLQFVPWQELAAEMWRSGHLPLWNPLVGCGAPLAANYQTGAFYPLNALHLLMASEVALGWTVALHMVMAGWGAYRWTRATGLGRFPAAVGALALQGSGFLVARAALFPSIAVTFAWIPIWLWRAEVLIQRLGGAAGREDGALRDALWLGLTLGLGLLAGHAQTASYGGFLLAAYVLFRAVRIFTARRRPSEGRQRGQRRSQGEQPTAPRALWGVGRWSVVLLASLAVGLGLAAVQLLPTAELLTTSQRSTGVGEVPAMTYSFWPWRLITLLAPGFFGHPAWGNYWGYGAHWEDALYVGLLPLLLAAGAVVRAGARERQWSPVDDRKRAGSTLTQDPWWVLFWALTGVGALVLALGKNTPVFPFLFRRVPGFDLFQAPARWLAVTTVSLSALAAVGAHHWTRGRRAHRLGALATAVGGALLLGGLAAPRLVTEVPTTFGPATVRLGVALAAVGALSLLGERARRRSPRHVLWWEAGVIAFIALDLLTVGWPSAPTVDRSLYQGTATTAGILEEEGDHVRLYWPSDPAHQDRAYDAHYRVKFDYLTFDDFGPSDADYWRGMREDQLPNAGMLDGVDAANNFDPLLIGAYADLMEAAAKAPGILGLMGVTHVVSPGPWPGGTRIHAAESAGFYRLPDAPGRAWIVSQARRVAPGDAVEAVTDPDFDPETEVVLAEMPQTQTGGDPGLPAGEVRSLRRGVNSVTIRASLEAPGYLVLAETWYPGWRVRVDGEPANLLRANHAFRGLHLTAGEHAVQMVYRPASVLVGGAITGATVALLVLGLALTGKKVGSGSPSPSDDR